MESTNYSQFACIGAGFAGIGLGALLKRTYNISDIHIFDRNSNLGGTWATSKYPGCACDVPTALYSFSFEQNPSWSKFRCESDELWEYLRDVAAKYELLSKMTFNTMVEVCEWSEEHKRWRLHLRDMETDKVFYHEAQILFSGSGQLLNAQPLDVPGVETFKGPIFHSSQWRHDLSLEGKKVAIVGNGCTAAQIVPNIVKKTKHLTQIIKSKHWIIEGMNRDLTESEQWRSHNIPGLMWLRRILIFAFAESELRTFPMTASAQKLRNKRKEAAEEYMRKAAPEKYHSMLIPDFEIGCKRRIVDDGYLACLHNENMTLTDMKALEIVPDGILFENGLKKFDVIILANGFQTNAYLSGVKIIGVGGKTLEEHWESFGGREAYNCTVMHGFPNFFMILGPNSVTGHTSAIMAVENSINYSLSVLKPVVKGKTKAVQVRQTAEEDYATDIQSALDRTVWSAGCSSWYVKRDPKTGKRWNGMAYPYSQIHFWYRCAFPNWTDLEFSDPVKSFSSSYLVMGTAAILSVAAFGWGPITGSSLEAVWQVLCRNVVG